MLDRPISGRIFFEQVLHDNLDIGRPDQVSLVFDRPCDHQAVLRGRRCDGFADQWRPFVTDVAGPALDEGGVAVGRTCAVAVRVVVSAGLPTRWPGG
jgi:hypothetical protein